MNTLAKENGVILQSSKTDANTHRYRVVRNTLYIALAVIVVVLMVVAEAHAA